MDRILVVGGSLAAVSAVDSLRERGFEGDVMLISAETTPPYDRPPLSKEALHAGIEPEKLHLRESTWYEERNIDLRLGSRAVALDPVLKKVTIEDGTTLPYDGLVLATGSQARRLPPGPHQPYVHVLRSIDDARRLQQDLVPGQHLVLVGGGFIGLEIAATARQMGLDVTVIEVALVPLAKALGDEVGRWYRELHERHGVQVTCGTAVESVRTVGGRAQFSLSDGSHVDADIVVAGIGAAPAIDWLRDSGLKLVDGVACRPDLSTDAPGVVAAGDIVRWYNPTFEEEIRVEHWTNAVEQGRHSAGTLLGASGAFNAVPYFWTDQFEARMRFVGRAAAADEVFVEHADENKLVALYGRDGFIRGAVCVNAPKSLAVLRKAIADRVPWSDIVQSRQPV